MNSPLNTSSSESKRTLLHGFINNLQVANGRENLLEKIGENRRIEPLLTDLGAAIAALYGQTEEFAALEMYDGEDTENFVCTFNEAVMCGTLGGASKIPRDKLLSVVAVRHGDLLVADAIMCEEMGFIWVKHARGPAAEHMANVVMGAWCFMFQLVFVVILAVTLSFSMKAFLTMFLITLVGWGAICVVLANWSSSTMNAFACPATEIFRIYGFADPENVNLTRYQWAQMRYHVPIDVFECRANHSDIYCYEKAIKEKKVKFVSSADLAS